jgi:hypothetical protein
MILVNDTQQHRLRWLGQQWRDKAGHVWKMEGDGSFTSIHGKVSIHSWKVGNDDDESGVQSQKRRV